MAQARIRKDRHSSTCRTNHLDLCRPMSIHVDSSRPISSKSQFLKFGQRPRSLLNNYGRLDCERGGCDDEARRPSISVVICKGGATKSARPPHHKMNCCSFSTDSQVPPSPDTS